MEAKESEQRLRSAGRQGQLRYGSGQVKKRTKDKMFLILIVVIGSQSSNRLRMNTCQTHHALMHHAP